jgi:hypothetical protein
MRMPDKRRTRRCDATKVSTKKTSKDVKPKNQVMWNPFWLRKMWLGAYAVLFFVLAVATLTLYLISSGRNGLKVSKNTTEMVYFWKFFPTASMYTTVTSYAFADALQFWWRSLHYGTLSIILLGCFSLGPTSRKVPLLHPALCCWIMCRQSNRRSYVRLSNIVNGLYL